MFIGPLPVWMEDYVPQFRKFWGNSSFSVERLVTSVSAALSLLQCFICLRSGQNYTVIDLQGGVDQSSYALCDVEFTNSLSSFPDLLNVYLQSDGFFIQQAKTGGATSAHRGVIFSLELSISRPFVLYVQHSVLNVVVRCVSTAIFASLNTIDVLRVQYSIFINFELRVALRACSSLQLPLIIHSLVLPYLQHFCIIHHVAHDFQLRHLPDALQKMCSVRFL